MYKLLSKQHLTFILLAYSFLLFGAIRVCELLEAPWFSMIRLFVLAFITAVFYWIGSSNYYSAWRILWRKFPGLNNTFFPDLNGIWVGHTESNWPKINKMRLSAHSKMEITESELADTPLQQDRMALQINASLFSIKLKGKLSNTDGESFSLTASVMRNGEPETINLIYIYNQRTPSPQSSDQDSHIGSADLSWATSSPNLLSGHYWTRRMWWLGLNTAGTIKLERVKHRTSPSESLSKYIS